MNFNRILTDGLLQCALGVAFATVLATTYVKYWNDKRLQSVVAKRFKIK